MKKVKQNNSKCDKYELSTIYYHLSTNKADSVIMPESTFGMNRYMYVDGNPVKFRDASGHNKTKNFFNNLGRNMMGGAEWAAKGMIGGAELASKPIRNSGLKQAADTFNKVTGRDYEKKTRSKVDYVRTVTAGALIGVMIYAYSNRMTLLGGSYHAGAFSAELAGTVINTGALTIGAYELGVRGGLDIWGSVNESISVLANFLAMTGVAGLVAKLTSPEYGLATFGLGLAVVEGNKVYESNKGHRKEVNKINCFRLSNETPALDKGGAILLYETCVSSANND